MITQTGRRHVLAAVIAACGAAFGGASAQALEITIFDQDFETPRSFIGSNATAPDVDSRPPRDIHLSRSARAGIQSSVTVETINVTNSESTDPSADQQFKSIGGYTGDLDQSGNFLLGMLSDLEDDRFSLIFFFEELDFLNVQIDLTNLDLDCCGGQFHGPGVDTTPDFQFSLFTGRGNGNFQVVPDTLLDRKVFSPGASAPNVIDFTTFAFSLDASDASTGFGLLELDLLSGGYAGFDNLTVSFSDTPVGVSEVPLPASGLLLLSGLAGFGALKRRKKRVAMAEG